MDILCLKCLKICILVAYFDLVAWKFTAAWGLTRYCIRKVGIVPESSKRHESNGKIPIRRINRSRCVTSITSTCMCLCSCVKLTLDHLYWTVPHMCRCNHPRAEQKFPFHRRCWWSALEPASRGTSRAQALLEPKPQQHVPGTWQPEMAHFGFADHFQPWTIRDIMGMSLGCHGDIRDIMISYLIISYPLVN
jgi:hypothetical protein